MNSKKENLEEIQSETREKVRIKLAIYAALGAMSVTCLLRLMTLDKNSIAVVIASCTFTVSALFFALISLAIYHVLHADKDLHIGHVVAFENLAKKLQVIGALSFACGFLLMLLIISWVVLLCGVTVIFICQKYFGEFKREMGSYMGAREALDGNDNT